MPAPSETLPLELIHEVYPGIAPERFAGKNDGRVIFIVGASRGIGVASAKAFAASGAPLFLTARSLETLEKVKKEIEAQYNVPVAVASVDATVDASVKAGVAKAVETYGKIDVVIANAGGGDDLGPIGSTSVESWMETITHNLGSSVAVAFHTIAELRKSKGYIIFLSAKFANIRIPALSAYNIGKLSLIRLAEWIHIENSDAGVKAFALHPGLVVTDFSSPLFDADPSKRAIFCDPPELSALSEVRLVSGQEDWLSGRFVDCTWNLDELAKHKEAILEDDALKLRLALPRLA